MFYSSLGFDLHIKFNTALLRFAFDEYPHDVYWSLQLNWKKKIVHAFVSSLLDNNK